MRLFIFLFFFSLFSCKDDNTKVALEFLEKENDILRNEIEALKEKQSIKKSDNDFEFKTYYNSDHQFKIDYPSILTMVTAYENGSGRDFISDGGEIRLWVSSSYYIDESMSDRYYQDLNDDKYLITYKVKKDNWYVVSGIHNGTEKEFYKKVYYSKENSQYRTMYLEYLQTKQSELDIIIPRLVKSFKDL